MPKSRSSPSDVESIGPGSSRTTVRSSIPNYAGCARRFEQHRKKTCTHLRKLPGSTSGRGAGPISLHGADLVLGHIQVVTEFGESFAVGCGKHRAYILR